jgi:hypothetical protein
MTSRRLKPLVSAQFSTSSPPTQPLGAHLTGRQLLKQRPPSARAGVCADPWSSQPCREVADVRLCTLCVGGFPQQISMTTEAHCMAPSCFPPVRPCHPGPVDRRGRRDEEVPTRRETFRCSFGTVPGTKLTDLPVPTRRPTRRTRGFRQRARRTTASRWTTRPNAWRYTGAGP